MTSDFGGTFGAARFARTRGRIGGAFGRGINYPSPFFDIGHTYLPTTVKQMFRWCRYYFLVHPLINTVAFKLSQYPITDLVYNTEDPYLKKHWKSVMEDNLHYRSFMEEAGLDYNVYGNTLVSVFFPFRKMLSCTKCKFEQAAKDAKYYFQNFDFYWSCPKCSHHAPAKAYDNYLKSSRGIRLLRWNPEDVDIRYNDLNGEYSYYYQIPVQMRNDIIMGKKEVVEDVPQIFIESLRKRKSIIFSKDNIFHMKRPSLAGKDRGWGIPLLLPVLKDAFYLQILKKSQEAVALEHIVPLRIMFPQAGSATSDPYSTINLGDWKDQIQDELNRWRFDNNYIPILPLPVGNQSIGGEGRALLLGQEIRVWSEQIVTGMGVAQELVFGGMSYSGSNVSLRMVENTFLRYMDSHLSLLNWATKKIAAYMDWDHVDMRFKPFKMADDLQRKAYNFQLNQAGKISDASLISDSDYEPEREDELIKSETNRHAEAQRKSQLAQAEIQGESQMIMTRYQLKAQQEQMQMQASPTPAPGEPGAEAEGISISGQSQPGQESQMPQGGQMPQEMPAGQDPMAAAQSPLNGGQQMAPATPDQGQQVNVDLLAQAQQTANYLSQLDDNSRLMALMQIRQQSPEFYQVVLGLIKNMSFNGVPTAGQPLPEQRPPRRGAESALI